MKKNIVLIGFMGAGKTSIGKRLSERLSFDFADTDQLIEKRENKKITEIFEEFGEEYFRDLETKTIDEMKQNTENCVVSTGGGLPLREENSVLLKELGFVVYLNTKKQTILYRVKGDTGRPLLAGDNVEEKIDRMLNERHPKYIRAAHYMLNTDSRSFSSIVDEIIEKYQEYVREQQ